MTSRAMSLAIDFHREPGRQKGPRRDAKGVPDGSLEQIAITSSHLIA